MRKLRGREVKLDTQNHPDSRAKKGLKPNAFTFRAPGKITMMVTQKIGHREMGMEEKKKRLRKSSSEKW